MKQGEGVGVGTWSSSLFSPESSTFDKVSKLMDPYGPKSVILATQLAEARGLQVQDLSGQLRLHLKKQEYKE